MVTESKEGLRSFSEGRKDILKINPRDIIVEPGFNVRDFSIKENQDHVAWLEASILEVGIKEPLTIRLHEGKPTLVGGESRLRAAMSLIAKGNPIDTIPCQVDERYLNEADRTADLIIRNSGKRLTPIEQAQACRRLMGFGWPQTKVAKHLGYTDSYVTHLLGLLSMPEEVQQMVKDGEVAASVASNVINDAGVVDGVEVLKSAKKEARVMGKRKVTGRFIQKAANKSGKKIGTSWGPAKVEKALKVMRWVIARAETIKEAREGVQSALKDILEG